MSFEDSASAVSSSAASLSASEPKEESEQYDDEEFEGYSDEFESDDDEGDNESQEAPKKHGSVQHQVLWRVGDHVQAYWRDQNEWFNGTVAKIDSAKQSCFVRYEDGDEQWESPTTLRFDFDAAEGEDYAQLQLLVHNRQFEDVGLLGRRVAVYWSEEMEWFNGKVSKVSNSDGLFITYDDEDCEWIEASDLSRVLIHVENSIETQSYASDAFQFTTASSSGQAVLTPRQYQPVVTNHFQPERVARPYKCVVGNHVGSILVARADFYRSRPYLHNATLECSVIVSNMNDCVLYKETEIQTDLPTNTTSA